MSVASSAKKLPKLDSRNSIALSQLLLQANIDLFAIALSFLPERRLCSISDASKRFHRACTDSWRPRHRLALVIDDGIDSFTAHFENPRCLPCPQLDVPSHFLCFIKSVLSTCSLLKSLTLHRIQSFGL